MNRRLDPEVEEAFAEVVELAREEQAAFLAQRYSSRPALRAEVESLLRAYRSAAAFLEPDGGHPASIGAYRVVGLIGAGGMGNVYRGERADGQFRQQVAIKMIGAGLAGRPEFVRRFLEERQILAGLEHPHIARLLDGGYSEQGAPYLVMEYVAGVPITAYCARHKLGLPEQLRLFLELADAVQYAHQHLVIHRDLKPANVLVTDAGTPKLLDFGIAKLAGGNIADTRTLVQAATLDYASPEQVRGTAVTTASDVYSLGVMLYELIAGRPPYALAGRPLEEALHQILTLDPPPPSAVAARPLPDDLDTIVRKAMRKEAGERYGSVKELADDIGRYLRSEPVLAKRGTVRYVMLKFARRHRAGVGIATAVALALSAAGASVAWEAHIARQERDRAERKFNDVRKLARSAIFDLNDKLAGLPGTTPLRKELVATALGYLDALAREAAQDAGLQREVASGYLRVGDLQGNPNEQNLGDLAGALESYRKAEAIARRMVAEKPSGENRKLLGEVLKGLVNGYRAANDRARAEASAKEAVAVARAVLQANPQSDDSRFQVAAALSSIAPLATGNESMAYREEAASIFEGLLAAKPSDNDRRRNAALMHKYLASELMVKENLAASFRHLERAAELDGARLEAAPNDPEAKMDLAIDMNQWAEYYQQKNDLAKAIEYTKRSLAIRRELAAADPQNMRVQDRLANILCSLGLLQLEVAPRQSLASFQEAKATSERLRTAALRLPDLALALKGIGAAWWKLGKRQDSCAALSRSVEIYRELLKSDSIYANNPNVMAQAKEAQESYARCPGAASGGRTPEPASK